MPDKNLIDPTTREMLVDPNFWMMLTLFCLAYLARTLVSKEPMDWRRLAGELILTAISAVVVYSAGLLNGMSPLQMLFAGALGSLGGLRAVEWLIKIAAQVKAKP